MLFTLNTIVFSIFSSLSIWASDVVPLSNSREIKLIYGVSLDANLKHLRADIFGPALQIISASKINQTQVIYSEKGPFDFIIHFTTSKQMETLKNDFISKDYNLKNEDAMTSVHQLNSKEKIIVTYILVDKVMLLQTQKSTVEAPNSFAKLILALAHEIFGNVRNFHEMANRNLLPESSKKQSPEFLVQNEIRAYRDGILAIKQILMIFKEVLSSKTIGDLNELLVNENLRLESWTSHYEKIRTSSSILMFPGQCKKVF